MFVPSHWGGMERRIGDTKKRWEQFTGNINETKKLTETATTLIIKVYRREWMTCKNTHHSTQLPHHSHVTLTAPSSSELVPPHLFFQAQVLYRGHFPACPASAKPKWRDFVLPVAAELAGASAVSNFFLLDKFIQRLLFISPTYYAGDFGCNMQFKTCAKIRIIQSI